MNKHVCCLSRGVCLQLPRVCVASGTVWSLHLQVSFAPLVLSAVLEHHLPVCMDAAHGGGGVKLFFRDVRAVHC